MNSRCFKISAIFHLKSTFLSLNVMAGSFLQPYSNEHKLSNGFDVDANCETATNPATNDEITCCGSYPDRYLFNSQLGMRGCCDGVVFDVTQMSCCPNGALGFHLLIGSCD